MSEIILHEPESRVSRQGYFIMVENEFVNSPNLTAIEKMVFMSLCTYAGKQNSCFPGQTGVAKNLGLSRSCVNNAVKSLELKGGLLILPQFTETNRKTVNTYFLADIDQKTGEFVPESLDMYRDLVKTPKLIRGK